MCFCPHCGHKRTKKSFVFFVWNIMVSTDKFCITKVLTIPKKYFEVQNVYVCSKLISTFLISSWATDEVVRAQYYKTI